MDILWMLSISMLSISIRPNNNRFRMQHPLSRTASPRSGCSSERLRREGFSRRLYFASFSCLPFICACKNREHSFHCAPCTGTNRPPGLSPLAKKCAGKDRPLWIIYIYCRHVRPSYLCCLSADCQLSVTSNNRWKLNRVRTCIPAHSASSADIQAIPWCGRIPFRPGCSLCSPGRPLRSCGGCGRSGSRPCTCRT